MDDCLSLDLRLSAATLAVELRPEPQPLALSLVASALAVALVADVPALALTLRTPKPLELAMLPAIVCAPGGGSADPHSPTFAWVADRLASATYSDGSVKTFAWAGDVLTQMDYARPGLPTVRKTLTYNPDGSLSAVIQTVI